jgi:hemerythrin-like domain-containing protein
MPVQIGQKPESGFDNPLGLLSDCHRRIEQFLKVLIQVCEAADGAPLPPPQIAALQNALEYFRTSAPKHTADEESSLFPRMRASTDGRAALDCMAKLESDHQAANRDHQWVEALAQAWLANATLDAPHLREMQQALQRLAGMYAGHIAIEDHELFPLAARVLPADALAEVGREMAQRRGVPANQGD